MLKFLLSGQTGSERRTSLSVDSHLSFDFYTNVLALWYRSYWVFLPNHFCYVLPILYVSNDRNCDKFLELIVIHVVLVGECQMAYKLVATVFF